MDFILRNLQYSDAESLAQSANNKNIAKFLRDVFPFPYTVENANLFIRDCIDRGENEQIVKAIVVEDKAVGCISIAVKNDVYRKSAELGYWLAEKFWGNGIMTSAVIQICKEAFDKLDIVRIFAEPYANNAASRKVLQNGGFQLEGILKNSVFKNGLLHDSCIYALLNDNLTESTK